MPNQKGEVKKLYYMDSEFKKIEVEEYNKHRDDLHDFCENNYIEWRVMGYGCYNLLSNKEVVKNVIKAGFKVKLEWIELINSPIEVFMNKLGD